MYLVRSNAANMFGAKQIQITAENFLEEHQSIKTTLETETMGCVWEIQKLATRQNFGHGRHFYSKGTNYSLLI